MLQCELCDNEAESVVIPLLGTVAADEVVLVKEIGYTCTECSTELIEKGRIREMPIEDHDAIYFTDDNSMGTEQGWLHSNDFVQATAWR